MIKIEFSLAIAVYLGLTVGLILLVWIYFEKRKTLESFYSENRFFWQCSICTYVYIDSMHNLISQCPRCGSYNKKEG
ncbi:MAG: hypothetical protein KJ957_00340 [Candidatus Omnitrophica bacterium]|nr:hypothetical protein [Candidatus Omnitrophota bacterium]